MAIAPAPSIAVVVPPARSVRDTGVDLVRALCVTGVVLLHAIMVGVTVSNGAPAFANASEGSWWITPLSWVLQVMPLFFIIGGFAGVIAYRTRRSRGGSAASFVAARVQRLLRPAIVVIAAVGAVLAVLTLMGVSPELVAVAGYRYGQPLWFLGVFLLCQALLPALAAAHERAPRLTLAALVAAALLVDAARILTGLDGIGFLNLAFVWLALQQLGFFFADGAIDALSRRTRIAVLTGAAAAFVVCVLTGVYSPDLIDNINPPTGALILVGLVHLALLSLFRERIARVSTRGPIARFSAFVNRRTMTIYLWHMPVLLVMAGLSAMVALATGMALPEPGSLLWWAGRPLWLGVTLVLTAVVAVALTRAETRTGAAPTDDARRTVVGVLIGIASVVLLLVATTTPLTATIAVVGAALSLRLVAVRTAAGMRRARRGFRRYATL